MLYFVFDVMVIAGGDVMREPLEARHSKFMALRDDKPARKVRRE